MNSIGGFREEEIDGKPFFTFTNLLESAASSGEAAIDSGGNALPLQRLFLCPSSRLKVEKSKRAENDYSFLPFEVSPDFSSHDDICKLPVIPLFWCNNKEFNYDTFRCGACQVRTPCTDYYFCVTCRKIFHKECVESPLEIKHPSFPFQSLQLYTPPPFSFCVSCEISLSDIAYHSSTNNLSMHPFCAMKPIPIFIDHPKRHPHSLTYFPKQSFIPCDVCSLIKELIPTYVCVRCVFSVHQDCIYFPHVIKISRHHHRISFTSSLPSGKFSCGVCRQKVDNHYGAYSCTKCNDYFVHTRCALRKDVCDGKELEGTPEEPDIDVESFERISDGVILHFSHGHRLKLEMCRAYDDGKFCQACVLPIYEGNYYSCLDQCDFILHESCAYDPRMKHHALHPHPLTLKVFNGEYDVGVGDSRCDACQRKNCGFVYESSKGDWGFRLDLRCASVSEPFNYQGHEHPLFLALNPEEEELAVCQICQQGGDKYFFGKKLNCIECDYIICFECATLPYNPRYKHDNHFLTFREEKEGSDDHSDWCEICEREIADSTSTRKGFYLCHDCCTTLHIDCLLGKDPYM